jgi:Dyp-type peroxidase family
VIDEAEVQGNVLRSYGAALPFARYLLYEVTSRRSAAPSLRAWLQAVHFGRLLVRDDRRAPSPRLGIGFTCGGLERIGVAADMLDEFPEEFRDGAHARAADNDDDTRLWRPGFDTAHVLVTVHAADATARDDFVSNLGLDGRRPGLRLVHDLRAGGPWPRDAAPGRTCNSDTAHPREQFGFADGCSQPAIDGIDSDPTGDGVYAALPPRGPERLRAVEEAARDLGVLTTPRRWRGIRAGEFVLGYENEEGELPAGPGEPLGANGTYMVYRVMEQHPEAFDAYAAKQAQRLATRTGDSRWTAELVKAKIVGRWPDGTPLTLSPDRPDPEVADHARRANDFLYHEDRQGYAGDRDGYGCPIGAHIRRVNPRDGLSGGGERSMRHRIIRRGMPYTAGGYREGPDERGLAFVCYSASLRDGFEFIQRHWCNDGGALGLGDECDMLIAPRRTGMAVPAPDGGTVYLEPPNRPFTTVRGCAYLFVPSKRARAWLRERLA